MLQLVTGTRNLSSWTLRTWLLMRQLDIPFEDVKIMLQRPDTADLIRRHSPSGKIPCLVDGTQVVWDSLAIAEYLAERFPDRPVWPREARERAHARSICAEMHAGFEQLRVSMKLDVVARKPEAGMRALAIPAVASAVDRIQQIWERCLAQGGPFLFGGFTNADAFFAPVVLRFATYGVPPAGPRITAYMHRVANLPHVLAWTAEARQEEGLGATGPQADRR